MASDLRESGFRVERRPFRHGGREHHNVVGVRGEDAAGDRVLVGAHADTVVGTPGADDNASGLAVLLEVARLLSDCPVDGPLELVAFDLEEPRGASYAVGSECYAEQARSEGRTYRACLVLEMVGYTDPDPGAQSVPPLLFWKDVPDAGTFLAVV
ncbi:MAG: M28 family peptidase, partial [Gemmatimonadota bacterium]